MTTTQRKIQVKTLPEVQNFNTVLFIEIEINPNVSRWHSSRVIVYWQVYQSSYRLDHSNCYGGCTVISADTNVEIHSSFNISTSCGRLPRSIVSRKYSIFLIGIDHSIINRSRLFTSPSLRCRVPASTRVFFSQILSDLSGIQIPTNRGIAVIYSLLQH